MRSIDITAAIILHRLLDVEHKPEDFKPAIATAAILAKELNAAVDLSIEELEQLIEDMQ